ARLAGRALVAFANSLTPLIRTLLTRSTDRFWNTVGLAGVASDDDRFESLDGETAGAQRRNRQRRDERGVPGACVQDLSRGGFACNVKHENVINVANRHVIDAATWSYEGLPGTRRNDVVTRSSINLGSAEPA